jgi:GNAT superfamily N-acetyltransferase
VTESLPALQIRLARHEELGEVGVLTGEVYVGEGYIATSDAYANELADAARRAAEAELWVAVEDDPVLGRVLGSVTFCPVGSAYREIGRDDEGEFRMLAVAKQARGRGVGLALVQRCLDRSRELGYSGLRISTMDRMTAAHRVYERLGFTRSPEDDWQPVPGVNLLAYALRF